METPFHKRSILRSSFYGTAAGLVGSGIMAQLSKAMDKQWSLKEENGGQKDKPQSEPATVKLAEKIAAKTLHRKLSKREKKVAGPLLHYLFGSSLGAAFGLLTSRSSKVRFGEGIAFGFLVWLLADETALPAFGLSKKPKSYPLRNHLKSLGTHVLYGFTLDAARSILKSGVGPSEAAI